MSAKTLIVCICYALFFLFVYASLNKLLAFDYYVYDLRRSPLLQPYATPIAYSVPTSEILVAVLLLPDRTQKFGLAGSVVLMTLFTLYVIYVLGFTTERPCTCGGIIRVLTWPQHLLLNFAFLVLALVGFLLEKGRNEQSN